MITDDQLLGLNVYEEAAGEIADGRAAVARVTLNRMHRRYQSDGTMVGTVLKPNQFSWAWYDYVGGKARRIAWSVEDALEIAEKKLAAADHAVLTACELIGRRVQGGTYRGDLYDHLTDDAVLYLNPDPRLVPRMPSWANDGKLVCTIGHHRFYRA